MLHRLRDMGFDIHATNHAETILSNDFPAELSELVQALEGFSLDARELLASGGGEAPSTQRLRRQLTQAGWEKHNFRIETTVDGVPQGTGTSHEIDHVRRGAAGTLALEIEWNNKDPFFDRDLENFQRLHAQSVISAGLIVTRGASLQRELRGIVAAFLRSQGVNGPADLDGLGMKARTARQIRAVEKAMAAGADFADAFARVFVADKFGAATTHWDKLQDRIARGVGSPCPMLLIGLPAMIVRR